MENRAYVNLVVQTHHHDRKSVRVEISYGQHYTSQDIFILNFHNKRLIYLMYEKGLSADNQRLIFLLKKIVEWNQQLLLINESFNFIWLESAYNETLGDWESSITDVTWNMIKQMLCTFVTIHCLQYAKVCLIMKWFVS